MFIVTVITMTNMATQNYHECKNCGHIIVEEIVGIDARGKYTGWKQRVAEKKYLQHGGTKKMGFLGTVNVVSQKCNDCADIGEERSKCKCDKPEFKVR